MNEMKLNVPDHLFEISWEVCNKVGGIHTVVATKARTVCERFGDRYILIGPDLAQQGEQSEFEEDPALFRAWRQTLYEKGIRARAGRWRIVGRPLVILIDFSSLIPRKDDILKFLWESYRVDSISGQWDYIEPVLFGHAAGLVVASYVEHFCRSTERAAAHFHEWMTVAGALYLRKEAPYVATLFTTHATVAGRCIAGNGLPLYRDLSHFNADEVARRFGVTAKHSIEKSAAANSDAFLTVSGLTANECKYLLGRDPDLVTPNGFEDNFVWRGEAYETKRTRARATLRAVGEACLNRPLKGDPLILVTSGRYEFRNKGLDVLLEGMKRLAVQERLEREVLLFVMVPAANRGARTDLQNRLRDAAAPIDTNQWPWSTHYLEHMQWDPVVRAIDGSPLADPAAKAHALFVPSYLNGNDGIFDQTYYELLTGADLTLFPSYYEPWGYTPLESIAFSVPTLTTSLAGFGLWIDRLREHTGVEVVRRDDGDDDRTTAALAEAVLRFAQLPPQQAEEVRRQARELSRSALWNRLFRAYEEAYSEALDNADARMSRAEADRGHAAEPQVAPGHRLLRAEQPTWSRMMVEKSLPERLRPLEELAHNLWWSWNPEARDLFESIDPELWSESDRNPIAFLDRINTGRMRELEQDEAFLRSLDEVYAQFKAYMSEEPDPGKPRIAYFSMEYGLHSSLKIYSGGLGILAGDYLKEASDKNVPMVAVGLLYRYGYFTQKLSAQGAQQATYEAQNFAKLPIQPVRDAVGNWTTVSVALPGRTLSARIWLCRVGRTELYLLDADYEANLEEDRQVTHHLYGGDWENRLKQEMLLGIGGVRALRALHIRQEVYHCNEGHAAFIGLERIRTLMLHDRLSFDEASEVIRSSSLFTTHTPVPAGHDAFPEAMIRQYLSHLPGELGIGWTEFMGLGRMNAEDPDEKFSMSVLACNLSQEVNGVSWLHGEVSKEILGGIWPGYFKNELHVGYVTNGVHFPTWTATGLRRLYARHFPEGFEGHDYRIPAWQKVHEIDDRELWSERMILKEKLIRLIRRRYGDPGQVRLDSPGQIVRILEGIRPDVLTIGFARRFATYKRASLLFTNLERLSAIVNNKERPVQFIFAGKAHPNDKPGQDLIKRIVEVSAMPQFAGKILFLQNYDMELARRMVQGVDVWLNTPTRPLEASGTSGEKCVMNGVLQFSVLDGWWVEGYREEAGWALPMEAAYADPQYQNELDAEMIYNTIEEQIAPRYYDRDAEDIPHRWLASVKRCIADIASNFTTNRMLRDYEERFYNPLAARKREITADGYRLAREIAHWKRRVLAAWERVRVVDVQRAKVGDKPIVVDRDYRFELTVDLGGLAPEEIGAELVVARPVEPGRTVEVVRTLPLAQIAHTGDRATYALDYAPEQAGMYDMALRVFPQHPSLPHRMDFALVKWA